MKPSIQNQKGAALITAMVLLIVMTLLALSSMQGTIFNSKMIRNNQTTSVVKSTLAGELFAQAERFVTGGNAADVFLISANTNGGLAAAAPPTLITGGSNVQLAVELRNLTQPGNADPDGRQLFGSLCPSVGVGTSGCENMLLTARANLPQVGVLTQHIGFGTITPAANGVQGININAAAP